MPKPRAKFIEQLEDRTMLTLLGQQLFPADNPWNQKITQAPVASTSSAIMNSIVSTYGNGRLHPDFGQDTKSANPLYGIPYTIVHGNTQAKVYVVIDDYASQSDLLDFPIPANAVLEGDLQNAPVASLATRGDSHLIVWDADSNVAYELYNASRPSENSDGKWHAAGEAVWNMNTNTFRKLGWTSADAAGLSILAGLVRPDEGLPVSEGGQGVINHAIRFTLRNAVILDQFLYPASHIANPGNHNAAIQPPMGSRFRLKASVDISGLNPESKVIATAMKDYGMILADNGSNFFFSGASYSVDTNNAFDKTWNDSDIQDTTHGLKSLLYSNFEVVDLAPTITSLSASSAAPGSQITITGQNFSGAAGHLQVLFGSTPATSASVLDDAHVTATVPSVAGTVDVRVQSGVSDPNDPSNINSPIFGYGISATTPADQFSNTGGPANHAPTTPTNVSPANDSAGVSLTPTFQAGTFSDPDTGDTQSASQWQIIRVSDSAVVYDSGTDATDLSSVTVPSGKLANSTLYHWQVRFEDNHGSWSNYSPATSFTTVAATTTNTAPNAPTNTTPADATTGASLTPTLQASAFSDPDTGDTQVASQWQIFRTSDNALVYDTNTDTAQADHTSITVPAGKLANSTAYTWQVRYMDNHTAWSNYSSPTSFTTLAATTNTAPNTPTNLQPADGTTGASLTPSLQASAFADPNTGDIQTASQWQIFRVSDNALVYDTSADTAVADHTSITVPAGKLANSTAYRWQVRYLDNHRAWSNYSTPTTFTTLAAVSTAATRIDAGGPLTGSYAADTNFSGGNTYAVTTPINTSGVTDPAPQAAYQTERYGNFGYGFSNLTPGAKYTVRLDFSENYVNAAGLRTFNVSINSVPVLDNFDIFAAAGGKFKAVSRSFTATVNSTGQIRVLFTSVKNSAKLSAISITPIPTTTAPLPTIDAGGPATGNYTADSGFSGGSAYNAGNIPIDTSAVTDLGLTPAPQAVYQTERYGNFYYALGNLNPGAAYTVRLDFSENYVTAADQRLFNVAINNTAVLTNFDIYKTAGGQFKAITKTFTATANSAGRITITFTSLKNAAKVNGISLLPSL